METIKMIEADLTYQEYINRVMSMPKGAGVVEIQERSGQSGGVCSGEGYVYLKVPSDWVEISSRKNLCGGQSILTTTYKVSDGVYLLERNSSELVGNLKYKKNNGFSTVIVLNGHLVMTEKSFKFHRGQLDFVPYHKTQEYQIKLQQQKIDLERERVERQLKRAESGKAFGRR
jgi:hypothetical protein